MGKISIIAGGVVAFLITFALLMSSQPATLKEVASYPLPQAYAVDATGSLLPEQLQKLNATLKDMDTGKHQFAVAIVRTTAPESLEAYSINLARQWKIGGKDTDNGALILIVTDDRKVRIEVGYGLEGDLNDAKVGRIIDEQMLPFLKEQDWYNAVLMGLGAINGEVK